MTPVLCGSAFKNKGVQPLLDAVIDYLPSPLDVPAGRGHRGHADPGRRGRAHATREASDDEPFAALAFKVMSDPYVGKLTYFRVYSGKLERRRPRAQLDHRPHRARRPHPDDARQPPRGAGRGLRGRHRRRRGPQADLDRRHPVRARRAGGARDDATSPTRSCTSRSSRRPRSTRRSWAWRSPPRRGGPHLPGAHRRGDRPDRDLRHGRAAPRGDRRPAAARVQRRGGRRPAPGGLPRDRARRRPRRWRASSSARPAARASTASSTSTSSRPPARASTSSTRSRAARCRRSSSPPSRRGSRRRSSRASRPAIRWWTCARRSRTASTTTPTPRRSPSRSPARWR